MAITARVEQNSDFQQLALPIDLAIGERVLQHTRLEAESVHGAWYELYLVSIPGGYFVEKHSGSSCRLGRQKETWFRRTLGEAERKYAKILTSAYSDPNRPPFRRDTGHRSGVNPADIPIRLRPLFRCNPASVK